MTKIIYTEDDIIELVNRGITTLNINDDILLTDLALEMAITHGIRLNRSQPAQHIGDDEAALMHRVKAAVTARLGDHVDPIVLDAVVTKVVKGMM